MPVLSELRNTSAVTHNAEESEVKRRTSRRTTRKRTAVCLILFSCTAACVLHAQNDAAWSEFQAKAAAWRALPAKPAIPDEVQHEQTQAAAEMQKKRLAEAAADYEAGLKTDPVWPEGQLQLAQIYAELDEFDQAIWHMQAYVALVPNSPDAQAAPDEIADWTKKSKELVTDVYVDQATHLMWPRHDSSGHLTQSDAINYCGNLSLGSFDGWRIPSSIELKTIYEKHKNNDKLVCQGGTLNGARVRTGIELSCNKALVWQSDIPYTDNAAPLTGGCFGFRSAGGEKEFFPGSLKCPVLCVRNVGQ